MKTNICPNCTCENCQPELYEEDRTCRECKHIKTLTVKLKTENMKSLYCNHNEMIEKHERKYIFGFDWPVPTWCPLEK